MSGDFFVILSSIFYSFHVIRLSKYASLVSPVSLAASKSLVELFVSLIVILFSTLIIHDSTYFDYFNMLSEAGESTGNSVLLLTLLWNGIATTAFTTWAQTYGQRSVSPTKANLIYTSQPLWAALFSILYLGERPELSKIPGALVLLIGIILSVFESDGAHDIDLLGIQPSMEPLPDKGDASSTKI